MQMHELLGPNNSHTITLDYMGDTINEARYWHIANSMSDLMQAFKHMGLPLSTNQRKAKNLCVH